MQAGYCRHVRERDAVNDSHSGCLPTTLSKHVILQKHKLNIIIDQWVTEMCDSQTQAWNITDLMGRTLKISNKLFILFMFDNAAPAVHTKFMPISIHPCMFWVFVSGSCCSSFTRLGGQSDRYLPFSSRSGSSAYCLCSVALTLTCVLPYRLGLKWMIDSQWDFQWRDKNSDLNKWICLNVNSKCLYTQS